MTNRPVPSRQGIAMLLVLSVLGLVTVVGLALLSEASLRAHMARNVRAGVSADSLAESGIELACYYLMNPHMIPPGSEGMWTGQTPVTFGANVSGSVYLNLTSLGNNTYQIAARGVTADGLGRTTTCTVRANPGFPILYTAAMDGNSIVPAKTIIYGSARTGGDLTNAGWITGDAFCSKYIKKDLGRIDGQIYASGSYSIPTWNQLWDYSSYLYKGRRGTWTEITTTTLTAGTVLQGSAENPAGVYIRKGGLTINSNVTIKGMLVVEGGPLNIAGSGSSITPVEGFPGLIVKGDIVLQNALVQRGLTVNGILWVEKDIKSSGSPDNTTLTVVGGALLPGGARINHGYGSVKVQYENQRVSQVNLDNRLPPVGLRILSFKQ